MTNIQSKLEAWFKPDSFTIVNQAEKVTINETDKNCHMKVEFPATSKTLCIHNADKNVLSYLRNDTHNKGAQKCADAFIFSKRKQDHTNNEYDLLVMELKKCINIGSYQKARQQLIMGIYNARAVAGFLGINIRTIKLSCGYCENNLFSPPTPIEARAMNASMIKTEPILSEWLNNKLCLEIDGQKQLFDFEPHAGKLSTS